MGFDLLFDTVEEFDGGIEDHDGDFEGDLGSCCVLWHETDDKMMFDANEGLELGRNGGRDVLGVEWNLHGSADANRMIGRWCWKQSKTNQLSITQVPSYKRSQTLSRRHSVTHILIQLHPNFLELETRWIVNLDDERYLVKVLKESRLSPSL